MRILAVAVVALVLGACGADEPEASERAPASPEATSPAPTHEELQRFPDVVAAEAERVADGTWQFSATLSSPYDTPERYADAWRVIGPDGTVYGVRELAHDHAGEQPFTRSFGGVEIPNSVDVVTIEGRDLEHGWGGATVALDLDIDLE